jgi:hypothetical protein
MRFYRALTYIVGQKGWIAELLISIVIAAIPVVGFFMICGWEYEISRRVRHHAPRLLPGWHNPLEKLKQGILIRFAGLLFNVPTFISLAITIGLWIEPIMRALRSEAVRQQPVTEVYQQLLGVRIGMILVTLIIWFVMNSLYWSGYLRYVETGRYSLFFDLATNFQLTFKAIADDIMIAIYTGIMDLMLLALDGALAGALATTVVGGFLVPFILPGVSFAIMAAFQGHLFGELAFGTFDNYERERIRKRQEALAQPGQEARLVNRRRSSTRSRRF